MNLALISKMQMCFKRSLLVFITALLLVACEQNKSAEAAQENQAEAALIVKSAWYRELPPGMDKSSAYMVLINNTDAPVVVTSAHSESVRAIEFHEVGEVSGMFTMRRMQALHIPPQESLELKPGGMHLMLFGVDVSQGAPLPIDVALHYHSGDESDDAAISSRKTVTLRPIDPRG